MKEYLERGFTSALPLLSTDELAYYYGKAVYWNDKLELMKSEYRCKANVLFKWAHDLSCHPVLLDYVSQVLGPNFDCWDTMFWFKKPGDRKMISPHQDGIYSNWRHHNTVNAWVALTPATSAKTVPVIFYERSHNILQCHDDISVPGNLLMRNQTIRNIHGDMYELNMDPGTVTLIHPNVIHGGPGKSPPADSEDRMGIEIYYVKNTSEPILHHGIESSVRMCGKANPNIYYDPAPEEDFGEIEQKVWRKAYDNQHANYYKMTNESAGAL
jgi:hypothetical protein